MRARSRKKWLPGLLLVSPSIILVAVFVYGLIGRNVYTSLNVTRNFVTDKIVNPGGYQNYTKLLGSADYKHALFNLLVLSVVFMGGTMLMGLVLSILLEKGVPVGLNGKKLGIVELIETVAEYGMKHGVGIVDHIEDRIVGLKVRDIYEVPAAAILIPAHAELERLTGTIHQNQFKAGLDRQWAYLVYAGLWWEPLRQNLDAYMDSVNEYVTGTIGVKLYKGVARVVTRKSPHAVYDASLASFNESGGLFSQQASPGFIELFTLQSRLAHRLHTES